MIQVGEYKVTDEDRKSILEVLDSGRISEGKKVHEFERMWADYCGTKYAVLTNSGTSALMLALFTLKMMSISKEVVTSPLTFIATINAIMLSGLKPVFADVDRETFNIIPEEANKMGNNVCLPVHLYGYPVDMDKLKFNHIIEDACEAHGSLYKGKKVGSIGLMGCFSFYIAHNIQVGDMGAITTNDLDIYKFLKKAKAHGRACECSICTRFKGTCPHKGKSFDPRFTFTDIAFNFKTTEFNAALGINQLKKADDIIRQRLVNVKYLNQGLSKYGDILQLPKYDDDVSYLAYPIICKGLNRDKLRNELEARGIETRPIFSCVPTRQPAYSFMKEEWEGKLPNAEGISDNGLHLGCHQYLTTKDLDTIIGAFDEILS